MACLPVESSVIKSVYKVSGKTGLCATLTYAAAGLSASCRKECSHNIQSAEVKNTANTVCAFHSLFFKKKSFSWFFCSLLFSCLPCSTHRWTNQHLPDTQVIQLCSAGILEDCTEAYICPFTVRTEACTQIDTFAGPWITQRQLYMGGRIRCDSSWADCQKNSWFSDKPKQQRWCCIETPVTPESPWLA